MKLDVTSATGTKAGTVDAPDELFAIEPNTAVLHQVVTAQLAHKRAGTHSTKTRAEVAGGGAKPWRQKGTGRARHGSIRSPQWRGGGVAHGPKPRDYSQRTPKKMIRLALQSALSDRASAGRVKVVDEWGISEPKTKQAVQVLIALGLRPPKEHIPRVLLVLDRKDHATWLSFRNLGTKVQIVVPEELNAHDVILNDWIVFSKTTLETTSAKFSGKATVKPKAAPTTATKVEAAVDEEAPAEGSGTSARERGTPARSE
ncbi:MAG: 50S ribosomal protein L4 [Actinobacteria bacterium]|nr:50S ribosomal protein L4 [Actinomycetota bacterium]